jgi:hypothetical protein
VQARIRIFGTAEFRVLRDLLSHYPSTGSQYNNWTLEYLDESERSAPQTPLEFPVIQNIDLFIRATYEIKDLAKLSNESIDGLPAISRANIFLQKSLLYCFHAIAIVEDHTTDDSHFAKSIIEAEMTLRSLITSLGLEPSLSVLYVSLQGISTLHRQALRTLVRLTHPHITSCSRLGSDLLLARSMSAGFERYAFVSLREDRCLMDDVSPYQLLLARYAARDIIKLYRDFFSDLSSHVDLPGGETIQHLSELLQLAEARKRLVHKSDALQKLLAKDGLLSLFISRSSFFNPTVAEEALVADHPMVLRGVYEEFERFYKQPLSILSTQAESIIGETKQQLTTLLDLASLYVNLKIQKQLMWLTILGLLVGIFALVLTT